MRKALIPLGIAAAIGVAGVVVSSVGGASGYVPATLELQAAEGTDQKVQKMDELQTFLTSPAVSRTSDYYRGIVGLKTDPEPVAKGNSFGAVATGNFSAKNGQQQMSYDRTLTIAENERGVIYRYEGTATQSANGVTQTVDQDVLYAVSRHGMFIKYNSYSQTMSGNSASASTAQYINDGIKAHRGQWYTVGISQEHLDEMGKSMPTTPDAYIRYMAMTTCATIASSFESQMYDSIDGNNQFLTMCAGIIEAHQPDEQSKQWNVYDDTMQADFAFNIQDPVSPKIKATQNVSSAGTTQVQNQNISLCHLDNIKVEIVETGVGDFFDLFGSAVEAALREQLSGMAY
ncbi:MAG: hypothetical protein E7182_02660 [Erysipelotrichaceae bacterium]|nr:hypothetical protein [Erysipelotrichaceae bacterium]